MSQHIILTTTGEAKIAAAQSGGDPVNITNVPVGDADSMED